MARYRVILTHSFLVTIEAEDSRQACTLAELFIGYQNNATRDDQEKHNFSIEEIEMTVNDAIDYELLEDEQEEESPDGDNLEDEQSN